METAVEKELKIEWVWEPRVPRGYVTLLGAKGGTGKSGFALWLTAKIIRETGKHVLYVDAENTLKHITTRIRDWGIRDVAKNIAFFGEEDHYGNLESGFPGFAEIAKIVDTHPFELIVIDSLTAIAHSANLKEERDASYLMKELRDLARIADAGLLLLCHTKKPIQLGDIAITVDDIAGSHALVDMARSVLLMASDPNDATKKTIRHGKHNFSAPADDYCFTLEESGLKDIIEIPPPEDFHIMEKGSAQTICNNMGFQAALEGKNRREIRDLIKAAFPEKDSHTRETMATRTMKYLIEKHNYRLS